MDKRFQDWDVEQGWLFPPSVLDLVPANHPAHFVRELVCSELELSAIFDDYAPGAGAPPYHPAMMTALEAEAKAAAQAKAKAARPARKNKGGRAPKPPSETPPDKAQRNFTDPESRIMRTRQTYEQAYNCQAAVDADSQVIVAQSVSNQQSDMHELVPILDQIKHNVGRQAREFSADMGYCCEENLKTLKRRRIRGYVATGRRRHQDATPTSDPWRMQQPYACEMRTRLRRGGHRSRYRLRKQTAEPVFGQIKEAKGFRRFLMRGLEKVRREWSLICTAHNMRKLQAARA